MNKFSGSEWIPPQETALIGDIGLVTVEPGKEIACSLSGRVRALGAAGMSQVLWIDDLVEGPADRLQGTDFQNIEAWSEGRKDSVQGVFFGRLAVGDEMLADVAVKPFLVSVTAGIHETAMLLRLESLGLPVYKILGVSYSPEQGFATITKFDPESKSLDNVDWRKPVEEPLSKHLTNLSAIEKIGESLGLMHANGILHRDSQVKNFAAKDDKVILIDLVQARLAAVGNEVDVELLEVGMFRDLKVLMDSLYSKGFLSDASNEEKAEFFTSVVATSYRSGLFRASDVLQEQFGVDQKAITERVLKLFTA